ncbi:MAG: TonB-dependent receptor [Xanthomonadales bacterium]|nr:TonB-dependent receptor [Xanthomonadales bacterium]
MSKRSMLPRSRLALGLAIALAAAPAFAQQTSSAVSGIVLGNDGAPISGAEIIITHTESGTTKRVTTDSAGRYNSRGLRVGGPYTIMVVKDGFQSKSAENVYLSLAETANVSVSLETAAPSLEAVEVIANNLSSVFSPDSMGSGTQISGETINALPSIRRDLQDYARLDPRISQTDKERSEISALGQNSRFNSITIDSVTTNDTFGLESNNLPTLRQPISLDAIEEVQINVVNYDVTQRGYTGANINAVTKTGKNEFFGSVYGTYRDIDMVRDTDDRGVDFNGFDEDKSYGFTFGGPLMRDTLFFFINYDKTEISSPGPDLGSGPFGTRITQDQVDEVVSIAQGYGLTAGNLNAGALDTEVETWLARFDWNINDDHRAAFRFSTTDQSEAILPGFGSGFFSLSSYWYSQDKEFDNYSFELFSDWTDTFSTEFRASYRDYFSAPSVFARQPQVQVDFGNDNFRFGTEQFRHANVLETETYNFYLAGNLFLGDHDVKFGVDYESNDIFNLFLESSLGNYRFSNTANFANGVYRQYLFRTSPTGNVNDAAANFTLNNTGLFIQDVWSVNYNLTLNFGLRYDVPDVADDVPFNQDFLNAFGIRNDGTIDGNELLQPRFGFNYTFDTDRPTQLRGGYGLFQGAAANVWLSNPFTNNGLTIVSYGCGTGGFGNCPTDGSAPLFSPDPNNQPLYAEGAGPRADVDLVSPNLEQPSVWKANLAIDHELPWWGAVATAEVIFTEVESAIYYEHLNLGNVQSVGPDGRNFYWGSTATSNYNASQNRFNGGTRTGNRAGFNDVLLAKETGKGDGQQLTLSVQKPYSADSNISWTLAYAFTEADEVNPLTSSRAISNWRSHAALNPGENVASRSAYTTKDRFAGQLSYRHFFFGDYKTEFSVFYEGRRGKPYSWVFNNDANGDNQAGNDLMFIPNQGQVSFTDPAEEAQFWQLVSDLGLSGYEGRVIPRNAKFAPWVNNFDVRVSQELPGFMDGHSAEIWFDIQNFGNLLNKDWGHIDEIFFQSDGGSARSFVNFAGIDDNGNYRFDLVNVEQFGRRDRNAESRWALQLGFRYNF